MTNQYSIGDISIYEQITKRYQDLEGSDYPPVRALIDLAFKEVEFNAGYVKYIIHKHLHNIADYTYKKTGINVTINPTLRLDIYNNNIDRENYDSWLEYYEEKGFCVYPEEIINEILKENNLCVLYYFYFKEEEELTKMLTDGVNDFNNRKFFIIQ